MIDQIGDRMKKYEQVFDLTVPPRMPVMIRLDGKAFHTLTKKMQKPFDEDFMATMDTIGLYLLKSIQGARICYVQSDEITLFLHTYNKFDTNIWMGGRVQKIVSISAGMASSLFSVFENKMVQFDSRVFVLSKEEVYNNFLWRSKDCIRNAILSYGQHKFGHKECLNLKTGELLNKIPKEEWSEVSPRAKFGKLFLNYFGVDELSIFTDPVKDHQKEIDFIVDYQEDE